MMVAGFEGSYHRERLAGGVVPMKNTEVDGAFDAAAVRGYLQPPSL